MSPAYKSICTYMSANALLSTYTTIAATPCRAAGLPVLPVQSFSRPVALDSGTQDARFRTTRLDPERVAMGRVYFCEHQTPDLVWRPEWQRHPNGAVAIARVVVATADPQRTVR